MNPYITYLETNITRRKRINTVMHLASEKDLSLDYDKYNIYREAVYINKVKVQEIYKSNLGNVFVLNLNPDTNFIRMSVDYDKRIDLLKSITCRYLIKACLDKYLNLEATDFYTDEDYSSFRVNHIFFENQYHDVFNILKSCMRIYIDSALNVETKKVNKELITNIEGLYRGPYLGPHLSNLAEIGDFKMTHYSFDNDGMTVFYTN